MRDQDWTLVRTPHEEWVKLVENMAKTLAYVWANRLIFYKALRAPFPRPAGPGAQSIRQETRRRAWRRSAPCSSKPYTGVATTSRS